jgi:hypothetical protein
MRWLRFAVPAGILAQGWVARAGYACPVCVSDTGVQVRALLAADPAWHVAATIAPIPALIIAVFALRLAVPWLSNAGGRRDVGTSRREPI